MPQPQLQNPYRAAADREFAARDALSTLRTLGILFAVKGVLTLCGGLFALLFVLTGASIWSHASNTALRDGGHILAGFIGVSGLIVGAMFIVYGVISIWAGISMRAQRNYVLCMGAAAIALGHMPIGTIVGGLALHALSNGDVRALFERNRAI
jgi:hypothetical protein